MLNFSERFQYIKSIPIYNPYSANKLKQKPVKWIAKAVAEGGQLVHNVPAHVAVRLFADGSLPSSWSGKLLDKETGDTITDVTVYNKEIGEVRFLPEANKLYALALKDTEGNTSEVMLRRPVNEGIAFNMGIAGGKLYYTMVFNGIPSKGVGYKLMGTMHDQFVFSATVQKSDGGVRGLVPVDSIPAGILQLTLFDEKETPVAERLCFLHQGSLSTDQPTLVTDTLSLEGRARNAWHFMADTINWISYSAQVNDGDYVPEDDFLSSIYLTSDFHNPIQQAPWYLHDVNGDKKAALDALLITENWERFRWTNLLQGNFPLTDYHPDTYLAYTGTVSGGRHLKPLREFNLLFQTKDSSLHFTQVKTDSSGTFLLNNLVFTDTMKVFYQPTRQGFFEPALKIDFAAENRFYPLRRELPATQWILESRQNKDSLPWVVQKSMMQINNERLFGEKSRMMDEVVIRTKARTVTEDLDKKLSSGLFSTPNATIFDFVNENQVSAAGSTNILSWLQGRVAGYSVRYNGNMVEPLIRNQVVQVFVDEMPMAADFLNSLHVSEIAMIKVIRGGFVGSSSNGAIAIYTRRGDLNTKNRISTLPTGTIVGYKNHPKLFSPDYSVTTSRDMPDDRLILFRESAPQLVNGKVKFPILFYNNAMAKSVHVRITGFGKDGFPVYLNKVVR